MTHGGLLWKTEDLLDGELAASELLSVKAHHPAIRVADLAVVLPVGVSLGGRVLSDVGEDVSGIKVGPVRSERETETIVSLGARVGHDWQASFWGRHNSREHEKLECDLEERVKECEAEVQDQWSRRSQAGELARRERSGVGELGFGATTLAGSDSATHLPRYRRLTMFLADVQARLERVAARGIADVVRNRC